MGTTAFSGPLATFTREPDGSASGYSDLGLCVLAQSATITQDSTTAVSATVYLPENAQILSFNIDVTTAYDSATSATLTIGQSAAGTDYVSGVDAKTAGRASAAYTATQLGNMTNIGAHAAVVATVTPVGATTAGAVTVTVLYVQKP
jgi:hypothetical protein